MNKKILLTEIHTQVETLVSFNISEWNSFTILLSFNFQSLTFFLCLFVTDTYTTKQWQDTKISNIYGNIISGFINSYPVRVFNGRNLYISSNIKILPFFEVKWSIKQDGYVWGTVSNAWSKCRFVFQLRVKPTVCSLNLTI